jgi:hypothetical protein
MVLLPGGWRTSLRGQDGLGGHIVKKHVGKTPEELAERARVEDRSYASSFSTAEDAERTIQKALHTMADQVDEWLASDGKKVRLEMTLDHVTGMSVDAAGRVHHVSGVRLILVRADTPSGYRVLTAFPQP